MLHDDALLIAAVMKYCKPAEHMNNAVKAEWYFLCNKFSEVLAEKYSERHFDAEEFLIGCGISDRPAVNKGLVLPIPAYGEHMTVEKFVSMCANGSIADSDGVGYFATVDKMSRKEVIPSQLLESEGTGGFTHVVWFNK